MNFSITQIITIKDEELLDGLKEALDNYVGDALYEGVQEYGNSKDETLLRIFTEIMSSDDNEFTDIDGNVVELSESNLKKVVKKFSNELLPILREQYKNAIEDFE